MAPLDAGANGAADHDDALSFLSGANATYLSELYAKYVVDRREVDEDWRDFFDAMGPAERDALAEVVGPSWAGGREHIIELDKTALKAAAPQASVRAVTGGGAPRTVPGIMGGPASDDQIRAAANDSIEALRLIRAFRIRGHLYADLDPLGLKEISYHPELDPKTYGFTDADYDRPIYIGGALGIETATLAEILDSLKRIYAGKIGAEFQYISDPEQKAWLQERVERADELNRTDFSVRGRRMIFERVVAGEQFEKFLDVKFKGTKRFGVDGGEAMIPALEQILKRGSQMGLKEVVLGMPHRGRLNVLTNFMGKPFRAMFSEFQGTSANPEDFQGSGDVKYHLGTSADREFDGETVHLSLTANPSHLEAVNPVVLGKVRAKQQQRGDSDRTQVMALLLHGDAAFAGQGIVPETLDLAGLKGYRTGGTIHFIVNNQIGFTTNPINSRTGPYCTEVAKIVEAPIFHVNGDDPEAVVHVARVATEFRQTFKRDVVIDMFCYRRFGHNEGDEPAFTQPLMYQTIRGQQSVQTKYGKQLVEMGVLTEAEVKKINDDFKNMLSEEFEAASSYKPNRADWLEGKWKGLSLAEQEGPRRGKTALTDEAFDRLSKTITTIPGSFNANRKVTRLFEQRATALREGTDIDWGTAENLAYAALLDAGFPIRFTGQDVERGTFSHRHAVITDQETEATYTPVNNIADGQAKLEIHNSPLSELAVLGYEHGYSLAEPNTLTMWEAQFGDFANGAQIIFDQFISSSESKWARMSGLTMLLPHGYEGQGPEHSSARPERFLQMCAEDNMQIVNCTTPANYFHVLLRQMKRDFRKPLIAFTPKSLLRHKRAVSERMDFVNGSAFHRVMYCNDRPEISATKRVVICVGKIYYDLKEAAEASGRKDVRFLRLEQPYPFPVNPLCEELEGLKGAEVVFCQEEPKNMGWWAHCEPYIEQCMEMAGVKQGRAVYSGREASASPATGSGKRHAAEQKALVDGALNASIKELKSRR